MKICIVHNEVRVWGGEETAVDGIRRLLVTNGHQVTSFVRRTKDVLDKPFGKLRAFACGIWNRQVGREFAKLLSIEKPDLVHIQNVYPIISPIVFQVAHDAGIPVVLRSSTFRMFCPTGLLMCKSTGQICEKCIGGKEYWCILKNCEGSIPKSLGYAFRSVYNRIRCTITRNTTMYYTPAVFMRQKLIELGISADSIAVVPTYIQDDVSPASLTYPGEYVGYAGRLSPEKGVDILMNAARRCGEIPFEVAGSASGLMRSVLKDLHGNVKLVGHLARDELKNFYARARFIVIPSRCYDTFPNVALEAMVYARPIIGSRIGGIPEIVEDGVTGLLFEPGNTEELASKICRLWYNPQLCTKMGQASREKALRDYGPEKYYERLIAVYEKAIECVQSGAGADHL